jgi:hypothetical protein
MPEYSNRPTYKIADGLATMPVWLLLERRLHIEIECVSCQHKAEWSPLELERRTAVRGKTFADIARRLKCVQCRSEYVTIGLPARRRDREQA